MSNKLYRKIKSLVIGIMLALPLLILLGVIIYNLKATPTTNISVVINEYINNQMLYGFDFVKNAVNGMFDLIGLNAASNNLLSNMVSWTITIEIANLLMEVILVIVNLIKNTVDKITKGA